MPRFAGLLVGLLFAGCSAWRAEMPTDKHLREVFTGNRVEFNSLQAMAHADAEYMRIAPTFVQPDTPPLTSERLNAYHRAFDQLGISEGVQRMKFKPGITFFIVSSSGTTSGGLAKGYAHSSSGLPTVASLDEVVPKERTTDIYYVKLEEEWYLFLRID